MSRKISVYLLSGTVAFLFIFLEFWHPISSFKQDLGQHLLLGKIIVATHSVPQTNFFSSTYPQFPFINTHWLSEIVFYLITQIAGLPLLLFVTTCTAGLSVSLLMLSSLRYQLQNNQHLILLPVTLLYSGILFERTELRPEIFSFFFMSIFVALLWKNREKTTSLLFILPFIELFWVNMHIYFLIGPVLIGLFLLEKLFLLFWQRAKGAIPSKNSFTHVSQAKSIGVLSAIFLLTCLATLVNPSGLSGSLYPFVFSQNYGYPIEENQSVFTLLSSGLSLTTIFFFFATAGLLAVLLLVRRKKSRLIDWLLYGTFSLLALSAIRNFPLFIFATAPTFIFLFPPIPPKVQKFFLGVAILFACFMLYLFISTNQIGYGIHLGAERAADFYLTNNVKGPLFNNFDIGSYLDYRFYPKIKVFVDGRPEAYPVSFFQNTYIPMQKDPTIFQQVDKQYHFQSIFFSYTDQTPWAQQFIIDIMKNSNWSLVYLDGFSAIWVKNDRQNQNLINRFTITPGNFSLSGIKNGNIKEYLGLAYFFEANNWHQPLIDTLQKIVDLDPANCGALFMLTQNTSTYLLYNQSYLTHCK